MDDLKNIILTHVDAHFFDDQKKINQNILMKNNRQKYEENKKFYLVIKDYDKYLSNKAIKYKSGAKSYGYNKIIGIMPKTNFPLSSKNKSIKSNVLSSNLPLQIEGNQQGIGTKSIEKKEISKK